MSTKTYRVDLQPTPGMTEDEGLRALRAFLKAALRSFGLRCTSATEIPPAATTKPSPPPQEQDQ